MQNFWWLCNYIVSLFISLYIYDVDTDGLYKALRQKKKKKAHPLIKFGTKSLDSCYMKLSWISFLYFGVVVGKSLAVHDDYHNCEDFLTLRPIDNQISSKVFINLFYFY